MVIGFFLVDRSKRRSLEQFEFDRHRKRRTRRKKLQRRQSICLVSSYVRCRADGRLAPVYAWVFLRQQKLGPRRKNSSSVTSNNLTKKEKPLSALAHSLSVAFADAGRVEASRFLPFFLSSIDSFVFLFSRLLSISFLSKYKQRIIHFTFLRVRMEPKNPWQ